MNQQVQDYINEANAFIKKKQSERKLIKILLFVSLGAFVALFAYVLISGALEASGNGISGLGIDTLLMNVMIFAPGIALIPGFLRFAWSFLRGLPASLKDEVPSYTAYVDDAGNVQVQRNYNIFLKLFKVLFSVMLLVLIAVIYFYCSIIVALIKFIRLKKIINETVAEIHTLGGKVVA